MNEIPEDVMKAAMTVEDRLSINVDGPHRVKIIAKAIMAERELCAKVAGEAENNIGFRALWLRGEKAYREFPGYCFNRVRDIRRAISSGDGGKK